MADRTIGELPASSSVEDASLFVMEQSSTAMSVSGALIKQYAVVAAAAQAQAAQQSASQAAQSATAAADSATAAATSADQASASAGQSADSATQAAQSATEASESSGGAASSATEAESWAQGGTGTRPGEDTDNAEYWASRAQAYAQQASVPPVQGVYNVILTDSVTGDRYALIVNNGKLGILGVANTLDATTLTLIDSDTGLSYSVIVENGNLGIEEVS